MPFCFQLFHLSSSVTVCSSGSPCSDEKVGDGILVHFLSINHLPVASSLLQPLKEYAELSLWKFADNLHKESDLTIKAISRENNFANYLLDVS